MPQLAQPEHTDAALDSLDSAGIRALHMVGAAMDKKASNAEHLPRISNAWHRTGTTGSLVSVGLFGQLNLDWWKVARRLDMQILTEFIGDLAKLGPEFAEPGVLGRTTSSITARACPRNVAAVRGCGRQRHRQSALGRALRFRRRELRLSAGDRPRPAPALGIDLDTAFGSDCSARCTPCSGSSARPCVIAASAARWCSRADLGGGVLRAATVNGARAAGLETSIGSLTPGKQADIIMVRTNGVAVFPVNNAIGTIVQAVERSDVDTVMVAGQFASAPAS
jgi:5-methylthioadenosine/S-adenosylhomocysteine deaminase